MRQPVSDIHFRLRAMREPRSPLASALVRGEGEQFVVLTLTPLTTARLMGRGPRALWETRVYAFEAGAKVGLGSAPRYAVLTDSQAEALSRHEALITRLEEGSFETGTAREVLAPIRPLVDRGAEAFRAGDPRGAVAALDEAIRLASQVDLLHHFLHLYQEAYLMRALSLECMDQDAARAACREFIHLYTGLPSPHPEVLRGVARAREAIERLTPTPHGGSTRRHARRVGEAAVMLE